MLRLRWEQQVRYEVTHQWKCMRKNGDEEEEGLWENRETWLAEHPHTDETSQEEEERRQNELFDNLATIQTV